MVPPELRVALILRCWEDPAFSALLRRDAESAAALIFPAGVEVTSVSIDIEELRSMRIPPSPLVTEPGADEPVLLAFWDGVFEPR